MDEFERFLEYWTEGELVTDEDGIKSYNFPHHNEMEDYCWRKLINGNCFNEDVKEKFEKEGFHVFIAERDSFGPLMIGIRKHDAEFYFG